MKKINAVIAGIVMTFAGALAAAGPDFPGLDDIGSQVLGPEITQEEINKQREHREKLEEFARQLKRWWFAQNNPQPMPYVEFKDKKIKLSKNFVKAYMQARKQDRLKETWSDIEVSFKKASMFKK